MKLQFIEAGEIVTTHGVKGEVKVLPWVDGPEILCEFDRCRIAGKEYEIVSCRVQKTCNLVKLSGVDTMEAEGRILSWQERTAGRGPVPHCFWKASRRQDSRKHTPELLKAEVWTWKTVWPSGLRRLT